ncbi:hypothetical protein MKW98_032163 [Papaver atlanticum]|uniref:C2 domain-containing protein n=1 Tax=Papaver atlanticum TaxID=357466 RepID=A0AAD4XD80_9MAGN|nr:hypothetical protein MKW98_032163 [Papaver atlanticum]
MAYRRLEVTKISARDIKDLNLFSEMDVYVLASIGGDPKTRKKTPVHYHGGKNPSWDFTMSFLIDESLAKLNRLILIFQLKAKKTIGFDRHIGEVRVPVKELLDHPGAEKSTLYVSYQVTTKSGKSKGILDFSYKFEEKVYQPANVYAAAQYRSRHRPINTPYPPSGSIVPYPPLPAVYPPAGYGQPKLPIGYPPQQLGYGYPPQQQPGYGYPPQGGYGMGMGMGFGAILFGGLLIGDIISDVGDYGGGIDVCGGGFDF